SVFSILERLMSKRQILAALFALAVALFLGGTWAQARRSALSPVVAVDIPSGERSDDIRQQTFEIVWRTVKEKHFDPAMGGVDWDKVRETYAPRAAAVKSDRELYLLLQEMLGELHQSHFNIIPPESVIPDDQMESSNGGIGIDLRLIGGEAMITRIEPDSSASKAGLRLGFMIKQVGDKPVEQVVAAVAKSAVRMELKYLYMTRRVLAAINGERGTWVKVVYLDEKAQTRETTIAREKRKGDLPPGLGNSPPQYTEFEKKRIPNSAANSSNGPGYIGYIRFNIF